MVFATYKATFRRAGDPQSFRARDGSGGGGTRTVATLSLFVGCLSLSLSFFPSCCSQHTSQSLPASTVPRQNIISRACIT